MNGNPASQAGFESEILIDAVSSTCETENVPRFDVIYHLVACRLTAVIGLGNDLDDRQ